jgi:hypothetical protein
METLSHWHYLLGPSVTALLALASPAARRAAGDTCPPVNVPGACQLIKYFLSGPGFGAYLAANRTPKSELGFLCP